MYEVRFYRDWVSKSGLVSFQVALRESDLMVRARRDLRRQAEELLREARSQIEQEIARRPEFAESLSPLPMPPCPAPVVRDMIEASNAFGVGPMAAVAGAVARFVGEGLLQDSPEVIVENGGDLFLKMDRPVEMGLYAGEESPFSRELKLRVDPAGGQMGVCTSSGTVGHSLSFGKADAVVTVAESAALADAAATAICNRIQTAGDIEKALHDEQERGLLCALLILLGKKMGAYGEIEIVT
jgi:hypothetical protein